MFLTGRTPEPRGRSQTSRGLSWLWVPSDPSFLSSLPFDRHLRDIVGSDPTTLTLLGVDADLPLPVHRRGTTPSTFLVLLVTVSSCPDPYPSPRPSTSGSCFRSTSLGPNPICSGTSPEKPNIGGPGRTGPVEGQSDRFDSKQSMRFRQGREGRELRRHKTEPTKTVEHSGDSDDGRGLLRQTPSRLDRLSVSSNPKWDSLFLTLRG